MNEVTFLVDTNVILRFLLEDHPEYSSKAKTFFKRVSDNDVKVEVPSFILAECVHVLRKFYEIPRTEIVNKLTRILNLQGIANLDRFELLNSLMIYQKNNIDFADCMLAALSSPYRKIISFDSDFNKLAANRKLL